MNVRTYTAGSQRVLAVTIYTSLQMAALKLKEATALINFTWLSDGGAKFWTLV